MDLARVLRTSSRDPGRADRLVAAVAADLATGRVEDGGLAAEVEAW